MTNPISLAAIVGVGASAAGAITGAAGSEFQGAAQSNMYNYQAGVAAANATIAKQDANYAISAGEVEAQQSGMRTRAEVGATRAGVGAGNIDTTTGSASKVLASETEIGQENEGVLRANAAKKAYGFNVKAATDTAQAGMYTAAATNSRTAGDIGAISSIIGGVGSVASKWMQASSSFGTPGGSNPGVNPDSAYGQQVYSASIYN